MQTKNIFLLFFIIFTFLGKSQTVATDLVYKVSQPKVITKKTPVLIMLHGYGSNESDLFDISKSIDERYIIFSLRAPIALKDGGFCWFSLEILPDQPLKRNYKEATESRKKILNFISNACKSFDVDSSQVFLMGFSQGAIMSYDLAFAAPKKIKGILALSGLLLDETKALKTDYTKLANVKFFIAHGNSDNVIKITEADKANEFLKLKKVVDLSYNKYEMPHAIMGNELNDIKKWLKKVITTKN